MVYLARLSEGALKRTVVLKVLKADWAHREEILTRARDEAVLLARLNHDNIVRVEQLTEVEGRPAVIMEHVQGLSVDHILRGHGPMPAAVAIDVASKVAAALHAAYTRVPPGDKKPLEVVHRDIKPSNIILSVSGAVKVVDFGTAHATFDAREARTSAITLGSPLYMAPECFDGAEADPTIDMYALGATLYEMLAGVPLGKLSVNPRKHKEKLDKRLSQLRTPELTESNPVTGAVRNLIERCLRYEPTRRPKAGDMRRLCMEFLRRMPRGSTLDQFSAVVVEPLYNNREIKPPLPLDATMSMSGPLRLGGSSEFQNAGAPTSSPPPLPPTGPTPSVHQPVPVARVAPPPPTRPLPPTPPPTHPVTSPPPPQEDEGAGLGTIVLLGLVGLVAGLLVIGVVALAAMAPSETEPETPEVETPAAPAPEAPKAPALEEVFPKDAVEAKTESTPPDKPQPEKEKEKETLVAPRVKTPPPADKTPPPADKTPPPADATPNATAARMAVKVVSMPAGAEVVIDGVRQRTPGTIDALEGVSSVYITFPDGTSGSCSVNIGPGTGQLAFRQSGSDVSCP